MLEMRCHLSFGRKKVNSQGYSELLEPIKTHENCYSLIWLVLNCIIHWVEIYPMDSAFLFLITWDQAPIVDWINLYPVDNAILVSPILICLIVIYPVDSTIMFERPGPEGFWQTWNVSRMLCIYISKKSALFAFIRGNITQFFAHSEEASDLQSTKAKFESRLDH